MLKIARSRRFKFFTRRDCGASMVEFAIVFPVFLLMFALVIDGGVYLYRFLRVTHVTAVVAREMSTATARGIHEIKPPPATFDCNQAAAFACNAISSVYSKTNDPFVKNVDFSILSISSDMWNGLPLIVVEGSLTRSCIACFFLPSSFNARAREVVALESGLPPGAGCPLTSSVSCP